MTARKECSRRRNAASGTLHKNLFLNVSGLFAVLTALVADRAGSFARGLAGCLALAASTLFYCILKVFGIQRFDMFHQLFLLSMPDHRKYTIGFFIFKVFFIASLSSFLICRSGSHVETVLFPPG
jgi:hypothetical protein